MPAAAIQRGPQGTFVYVVKADQTVEVRPVTVGPTEGSDASIDDRAGRRRAGGGRRRRQAARRAARCRCRTPDDRRRAAQAERMNPSRLFILRPVATSLLMAAILLAGAVAYRQLPVSALPQVDYPTIQVLTFYPGASPDVMASSVTAPLERQFGQVPGLNQMTSTSSVGSSVITLQFALDLNIDVAEQEVQAAINAAATYLAARSAEPADLQQDQPGRRADPDAGADLADAAACRRCRTWPTRGWRRRSRSCPASAWSASAADRSRRCAFRPIRRRWRPTGSAWKTCARRSRRPTSTRRRATSTAPQQAYTIGANDQLLSSDDYRAADRRLPQRRAGAPRRTSPTSSTTPRT